MVGLSTGRFLAEESTGVQNSAGEMSSAVGGATSVEVVVHESRSSVAAEVLHVDSVPVGRSPACKSAGVQNSAVAEH